MDPRISFVTLVVADVERSHAFYVDGLGWQAHTYVPGEVLMIQVGDALMLSLWAESGFQEEVGPVRRGDGIPPVTLAQNHATEAEVDGVLALATSIGAEASPATRRDWGGYTGYFADPDGFRWEIAVNPAPGFEFLVP